jgi:hypothetical protein
MPHVIAIAVFLIVTLIFCRPALESNVVLQQHDMSGVRGMTHQLDEYKTVHGHSPLWLTNMFSGMPTFQTIGVAPDFYFIYYIDKALQLWLPQPMNYFFLCCLCFYIMCMCFSVNSYVSILGSIGYAFATYNPSIIGVGHITKMLSMAYAPAWIGSVYLLFQRKYLLGFFLTALFASLQLSQNHAQISYYLAIVIGIMCLINILNAIKNKDIKSGLIATGLVAITALIGLFSNATVYFPTLDYAKESKRGGQLIMDGKTTNQKTKDGKTSGLDREYAFQWSYGKLETVSLMVPGVQGYGAHVAQRDGDQTIFPMLDENSKTREYITTEMGVPAEQADQFTMSMSTKLYWGDQPFLDAPNYSGAVICFLFIVSLFFVERKHLAWILTASLVGIILGWGRNFPAINNFLFDYLPMYNKFRTPSMAFIIPQILLPFSAVLGLNNIYKNHETLSFDTLKKSLIAGALVLVAIASIYFTASYTNENKERTTAFNNLLAKQSMTQGSMDTLNKNFPPEKDNQLYEQFVQMTKGDVAKSRGMMQAFEKDRASLFGKDLLKTILYSLLVAGLLIMFFKTKTNKNILIVGIIILSTLDLFSMASNYLDANSYEDADKYANEEFVAQPYNNQILQDKDPNFRVFDISSGDPFQSSKPSYFHKSIGGYHPAKLGIYDDLYTYQLSGKININVLNMLNCKYIINQSQQGEQAAPIAMTNPTALGNAWFVKNIAYVKTNVEEMRALDNLNTKDSAIANISYEKTIGAITPADSNDKIKQTMFDNDAITYQSKTTGNKLALFSEIYYKDWKAYIDGKEAPIAKVNYVLRALNIPAGEHKIEFKFEPNIVKTSKTLSNIGNGILLIIFLFFAFSSYKNRKLDSNL